MKAPLFPDVAFESVTERDVHSSRQEHASQRSTRYLIKISTVVRMREANRWYRTLVLRSAEYMDNPPSPQALSSFLSQFLTQCYGMLLLGKVNENIVDSFGNPLYEKEEDTESSVSEIERMRQKLMS